MDNMIIKPITAAEVYSLRLMVLRPGGKLEDCIWEGDEFAQHWAVLIENHPVCIASFYHRDFQGNEKSVQLRGMATHPAHQGKGFGMALVKRTIGVFGEKGYEWMWCNAREKAVEFYRKLGFTLESEAFQIEGVGTHYKMKISLSAE